MSNPNSPTYNSKRKSCVACHQRTKCTKNCPLAPFFPVQKQDDFEKSNKLFGVPRIEKTIKDSPPLLKEDQYLGLNVPTMPYSVADNQSLGFGHNEIRENDPLHISGHHQYLLQPWQEHSGTSASILPKTLGRHFGVQSWSLADYEISENDPPHVLGSGVPVQSREEQWGTSSSMFPNPTVSFDVLSDQSSSSNENHPLHPWQEYFDTTSYIHQNLPYDGLVAVHQSFSHDQQMSHGASVVFRFQDLVHSSDQMAVQEDVLPIQEQQESIEKETDSNKKRKASDR